MKKHDRKLKNFLLTPKVQLPYMYHLLAVILIPLAVLFTYTAVQILVLRVELANMYGAPTDLMTSLDAVLMRVYYGFGFMFIFTVLILMYGSVVVSHRFVGPMHVINMYIKGMLKGEYDFDRELRKGDEMKETLSLLKELGAKLKAKHN
jgi:hypothetical protein